MADFDLASEYANADGSAVPAPVDAPAPLTFTPEDITTLTELKANGDMAGIGEYVAQLLP